MKTRTSLPRRAFLRGVLGGASACVALPALEAMLDGSGQAYANGDPLPVRFITFYWPGGCQHAGVVRGVSFQELWNPSTTGPSFSLPPQLAPLSSVASYVSVLSGFSNPFNEGHHGGMAAAFSGHPHTPIGSPTFSQFTGPSIDQVVADRIGGATAHASIQIGVAKAGLDIEGPTIDCLSHRAPPVAGQPALALPAVRDPAMLYAALFGGFAEGAEAAAPRRLRAIDAVMEDAKALRGRLGAADRGRLDAHLDGLRGLETQIEAVAPACALPGAPTIQNEVQNGYEPIAAVSDVMAELVVAALACDLTRVASFMLTNALQIATFPGQGVELHRLEHYFGTPLEGSGMTFADSQALVAEAVTFSMQRLAVLLERLAATPEGSGNLLDGCAVFASTDLAQGTDHLTFDTPMLIAGRGGGRIVHPGIHHRSPTGESMSNALLAAVRAAAPEVASVGADAGFSATPCSAILTGAP